MSRTVYYDHSGNEAEPPKADAVKPTNADRIRSMTDEELAKLLHEAGPGGLWGTDISANEENWLDWLREEAD